MPPWSRCYFSTLSRAGLPGWWWWSEGRPGWNRSRSSTSCLRRRPWSRGQCWWLQRRGRACRPSGGTSSRTCGTWSPYWASGKLPESEEVDRHSDLCSMSTCSANRYLNSFNTQSRMHDYRGCSENTKLFWHHGMISAIQKQKAHTCKMPSTSTNMPRPLCAWTSAWILLYNDTPATTPARPRMNPTNWIPAWR